MGTKTGEASSPENLSNQRLKTKRLKTKRLKTKRKTMKKNNSKYFKGFLYSQNGGSKLREELREELDRIVIKFDEVGSKNITFDGIKTIRQSLLIINKGLKELKGTWGENNTSNNSLLDYYNFHLK